MADRFNIAWSRARIKKGAKKYHVFLIYSQLLAKLILAKVADGWGSFFKPFQGKKISSTLQFTEPYKSARDHK